MSNIELLAFVYTPLAVLLLGWGVAIWARHYAR
jgi:hypothetical protein